MAVKINKIDQLEGKSELVQEVMARKPSRIIRYGTTVFFLVILGLLAISWLIRFPDVISASTYLTTSTPPVKLVSKTDGNLHILSEIGYDIRVGEAIAFIESSTDFSQAIFLLDTLLQIKERNLTKNSNLISALKKCNRLGEYQTRLNPFIASLENFHFNKRQSPFQKEISAIEDQILKNSALLDQKRHQIILLRKEFELIRKDHLRNELLFKESVISEKDLDESSKAIIRSEISIESVNSEIISIQLNMSALKKNITQLQNDSNLKDLKLKQNLTDSFHELVNNLDAWKQMYVFVSPANGKLLVHEQWSSSQYVTRGKHVFSIVPKGTSRYKAIVQIPTQNSGKLKTGQRVNILLNDYPYEEFGTIKGEVKQLSLMPKENMYMIEVHIMDSALISSFGKSLQFRPEMTGKAEIITEDLRLIERLFYQLRSAFRKDD